MKDVFARLEAMARRYEELEKLLSSPDAPQSAQMGALLKERGRLAKPVAAYRNYTNRRQGEPLELDAWFHWYHVEKDSERQELVSPPSGCSVDNRAVNYGTITRPEAFLQALKALFAMQPV